jgi:hypothetical protein
MCWLQLQSLVMWSMKTTVEHPAVVLTLGDGTFSIDVPVRPAQLELMGLKEGIVWRARQRISVLHRIQAQL